MGFFASWPDRRSLFIDTDDEKKARAIARDVGEAAPKACVAVPSGVLVFEVYDPEDADEDDPILVEPIPVAEELLASLEDAANADTVPVAPCSGEALDDEEELIRCELGAGHYPATKHRNGRMVWGDE